jgi:ABC-type iron transport system FetAB ATPase subunit
VVDDLWDELSSLVTDSSASDGVRGSVGLDECGKGGWFLMAAATLDSPTSGELTWRGVLGFSERRRDGSEVPSCII